MVKTQKEKTLTAIILNHKEVAMGTFASILRQANMTRDEFESLMK